MYITLNFEHEGYNILKFNVFYKLSNVYVFSVF